MAFDLRRAVSGGLRKMSHRYRVSRPVVVRCVCGVNGDDTPGACSHFSLQGKVFRRPGDARTVRPLKTARVPKFGCPDVVYVHTRSSLGGKKKQQEHQSKIAAERRPKNQGYVIKYEIERDINEVLNER